mgnify:CR=1 FL=1
MEKEEEDQEALVGKYIAGELRQITDARVKLTLKMTIHNEIAQSEASPHD